MITFANTSTDPFYNQAFEEHIFNTYKGDDVFLLWQNAPAVIVGCYQNIFREVRVTNLQKINLPLVRRMSGGGTVYHDLGNINYTFMTDYSSAPDYDHYMKGIIDALNDMDIPAKKKNICDISLHDMKISGSAQKVSKNRILHHGTLLFDTDLNRLDEITTLNKNEAFQSKGVNSKISKVTNISRHMTVKMDAGQFKNQLLQRIVPKNSYVELSQNDIRQIESLRDNKYKSWDWTWKRNPAFTYKKSADFLGKKIDISYSVKNGLIRDVSLDSEFIDSSLASRLLTDTKISPENIISICGELAGENFDALANLLM